MSLPRQLALLAVLALVATGGYGAYTKYFPEQQAGDGARRGGGTRAVAVTLTPAQSRRIERRVEAVGTSMALQAVDIVPLTSGRIVDLGFEPGDRIEAGAVLARLDDDIERADLTEADAKLAEATHALERATTLSASNTISRASVEQLTAAKASAQASLDRARRRLADRTVRAPFAGIVGLRKVDAGTRVDDNMVITTLDDLSRVQVEFALPETVYGQVKTGLGVRADSAAFPGREFTGRVETIDSRIDPVSRSFKVRAILPNEDLVLPAGMFMHLAVVLDAREALMVPEEAITVQASEAFVFVAADGRAERRVVSLGQRDVGAVEITDGLADGEMIVVRGVQSLRDGAEIRDIDAAPEAAREPGGERRRRPSGNAS